MTFPAHKINWRLCYYTALFFMCLRGFSQQAYFQQEVNYTINVSLNDTANTLSAFETIQYTNNSSCTLEFIYFHLWPNAYKNSSTALSQDLLKQGRSELYFSKPGERGFIDSLNFRVNGKAARWQYDAKHNDICKLLLEEPLRPSESISITTPFFVKIPDARFSRLGHAGQAYFITQWYPRPAVFDKEGWHPMPYLDQGEFYSEFGSFDVSITLPDNYVLAATGDRVDAPGEEKFLEDKAAETLARLKSEDYRENDMRFPESSANLKTIRFKQQRVHDFAWFADKRFNVVHDQITLPQSNKKVDTWVLFTNKNFELWKNAISYVNESTLFYSTLNGNYPYNHVTAVDGTNIAGGGMEYPNIAVIGDMPSSFDLDFTIAHEVGHNWFYGILASNERDYPFMDEGINSLYEMRYVRAKYPEKKMVAYIGRDSSFNLFRLNKLPAWRSNELAFFSAMRAHTDQPMDLPSPGFTTKNYGAIVYSKSALVFDYLMDYMGADKFDKAMQQYFELYKFKHPSPQDLMSTLSASSGMNLDAFTSYLINSTAYIDYKIKKVKRLADSSYAITVKNRSGVPLPFNMYGYKDGKPVSVTWFDGFKGLRKDSLSGIDVDYFKIDGQDRMPDLHRRNNSSKRKPLQLSFLTALEDPSKTQINYLPITSANLYNGFMLGAAIHNYSFYQKTFEYSIAPMFAFRTKTPVGFAEFNFNIYPKKRVQQIVIGAKAKSFAYDYFNTSYNNQAYGTSFKNLYFNYYKITPYIQFELKKKTATSSIRQFITYASNNIFADSLKLKGNLATDGPRKNTVYSFVNQLSYHLYNSRTIDPFSLALQLQHTGNMAKVFATLNYKISLSKREYFDVRVFAGAFVAGSEANRGYYAFRAAGYTGYQDYLFDGSFVGRNETSGIGFSQFMEQDGALKVYTPLGQSSRWLTAVNIKSPQLFILPIKVFADIAVCDKNALLTDKLLWDAGINLTIFKDIVEIYVPLFYNNDIKQTLQLNNISFLNRIRFTFNIHKLAPKTILQSSFF